MGSGLAGRLEYDLVHDLDLFQDDSAHSDETLDVVAGRFESDLDHGLAAWAHSNETLHVTSSDSLCFDEPNFRDAHGKDCSFWKEAQGRRLLKRRVRLDKHWFPECKAPRRWFGRGDRYSQHDMLAVNRNCRSSCNQCPCECQSACSTDKRKLFARRPFVPWCWVKSKTCETAARQRLKPLGPKYYSEESCVGDSVRLLPVGSSLELSFSVILDVAPKVLAGVAGAGIKVSGSLSVTLEKMPSSQYSMTVGGGVTIGAMGVASFTPAEEAEGSVDLSWTATGGFNLLLNDYKGVADSLTMLVKGSVPKHIQSFWVAGGAAVHASLGLGIPLAKTALSAEINAGFKVETVWTTKLHPTSSTGVQVQAKGDIKADGLGLTQEASVKWTVLKSFGGELSMPAGMSINDVYNNKTDKKSLSFRDHFAVGAATDVPGAGLAAKLHCAVKAKPKDFMEAVSLDTLRSEGIEGTLRRLQELDTGLTIGVSASSRLSLSATLRDLKLLGVGLKQLVARASLSNKLFDRDMKVLGVHQAAWLLQKTVDAWNRVRR